MSGEGMGDVAYIPPEVLEHASSAIEGLVLVSRKPFP